MNVARIREEHIPNTGRSHASVPLPAIGGEATLYCHSYPLRRCGFHFLDHDTIELDCDLGDIPQHAFLELGIELFVDDEIKRLRQAVYRVAGETGRNIVRWSFPLEPAYENAIRQWVESQESQPLAQRTVAE